MADHSKENCDVGQCVNFALPANDLVDIFKGRNARNHAVCKDFGNAEIPFLDCGVKPNWFHSPIPVEGFVTSPKMVLESCKFPTTENICGYLKILVDQTDGCTPLCHPVYY